MAKRDEFDDEGFFDSLLNRKGKTALPHGLRKVLIVSGLVILTGIVIAVVVSSLSSGESTEDMTSVPIIRADTTPYKIKPQDPGGMNVPNKDSTIFETLKGEKEETQPENLLEDESDTATSVVRPETAPELAPKPDDKPVEEVKDTPIDPQSPVQPEAVKTVTAQPEKVQSIIESLKEDSKPPQPASAPKVEPAKPSPAKPVPAKPVPSQSVTPGGSTYIQLAAVKSEGEAGSQWSKFKAKNPELAALTMRTQKADLGEKGIYYRIQAGPLSAADATKTCLAVKSRGGNCIIAK